MERVSEGQSRRVWGRTEVLGDWDVELWLKTWEPGVGSGLGAKLEAGARGKVMRVHGGVRS